MRQQSAAAMSSEGFYDLTAAGSNSAPSAVKPHSTVKNAGSIHDPLK